MREGVLESVQVAVGLEGEAREAQPKVVGSAWTPWVRPTQSVSRSSSARLTSASR